MHTYWKIVTQHTVWRQQNPPIEPPLEGGCCISNFYSNLALINFRPFFAYMFWARNKGLKQMEPRPGGGVLKRGSIRVNTVYNVCMCILYCMYVYQNQKFVEFIQFSQPTPLRATWWKRCRIRTGAATRSGRKCGRSWTVPVPEPEPEHQGLMTSGYPKEIEKCWGPTRNLWKSTPAPTAVWNGSIWPLFYWKWQSSEWLCTVSQSVNFLNQERRKFSRFFVSRTEGI